MRTLLVGLLLWSAPSLALAEKLELRIHSDDIDVAGRTIHFALATVARMAEIEVYSPDGELLHAGHRSYEDPAPGAKLEIGWPDLGKKGENFRIELKFTDSKDNWVTFQVIRFYVEVPHEEVEFETGKWAIPKDQEAKLQRPLSLL